MRSFKSVGVTQLELTRTAIAIAPTPIPIGIITPLRHGSGDEGLLALSYDVGTQMKNNLRDLIMTDWGERLALYDYGGNLTSLCTEYERFGKEEFDSIAMSRISTAVAKFMPYVELGGFESQQTYATEIGLGNVIIIIEYSIPKAKVPNTRLQIVFKVI